MRSRYPAATRQAAGHFNKIQQDELGSHTHNPLHHSVLCLLVQGAARRGSRDSGVKEREVAKSVGSRRSSRDSDPGNCQCGEEHHYGRIPRGPGASQVLLAVS